MPCFGGAYLDQAERVMRAMQGFTLAAPAIPRESRSSCSTLLDASKNCLSSIAFRCCLTLIALPFLLENHLPPSLFRPAGLILLYAPLKMEGSRPVLALIMTDSVIRVITSVSTLLLYCPRGGSPFTSLLALVLSQSFSPH